MDNVQVEALAVIPQNNDAGLDGDTVIKYIEEHLVSVQDIEVATELKFFPKASAPLPGVSALWALNCPQPHSLTSNCRATFQ